MTDAAALPGAAARCRGVRARHRTGRERPGAQPSAMTLDGTNTWILSEPDSELAVVVDPGPLDEGHLRHVRDTASASASGSP